MKVKFLITALFLVAFIAPNGFSQGADKIKGYWLTQDGDSQVKIFKATNGKYYGEIVWLETPNEEDGTPKLDKNNENEKLRKEPVMGLRLLKGFKYDADDKEWVDGTIYDPKNGKTYKCFMWFDDDNDKILSVKGFIGFSLIGREVIWTREEKLRE